MTLLHNPLNWEIYIEPEIICITFECKTCLSLNTYFNLVFSMGQIGSIAVDEEDTQEMKKCGAQFHYSWFFLHAGT